MAKADIQICLRSGTESYGASRFRPGEFVQGSVVVVPDSDVKCNHLYIRLEWYTEGRGTQFRQKIDEKDVFQGTLNTNMPRSFEFDFQLPEEPWSYEGHYISIVWGITVQLDVPWGRDVKEEAQFVLRPTPGTETANNNR
ncbi:MAG: hypothetical protein H6667_00525 [Ardenticatenaceae bacterium]|nr:hypothetical protein [Ardenticatenaceae bacterium]MCB9444846.1 hypothetical protein [Ardenticatenaceae bacterium]